MTEIRFYHLQTQSVDQALPQLLSKAYSGGHKIIVRTADEKEAERLNTHLWSFHPDSFIPHGNKKDGYSDQHPIWLTHENDNPNGAGVLFVTGREEAADAENYSLCCEIFDGRNDSAVANARAKWKTYKDSGHDVTYWQQNQNGGWDKKS